MSGDTVRYTVKELLAEIRDGISEIRAVANQHDQRLTRLEERQDAHSSILDAVNPQLTALQKIIDTQAEVKDALNDDHKSAFTRRERFFGMLCAALIVVLTAATTITTIWHAYH